MQILIVGGGIGGLTAALGLAIDGHQVQVFEQAAQFSEAGAGLQLSANASRVLIDLGLMADLQDVGFLPQATRVRHWKTGKLIIESPLGDTATERFGSPYFHIHRGDLLNLLLRALRRWPNVVLRCNAQVTDICTHPTTHITVNQQQFYGDCCIGADGIHSLVRHELFGEVPPRFTGNVAWRTLLPSQRLDAGVIKPETALWWGPGKHLVHYYVCGGAMVNCVCVVENATWRSESWTQGGDKQALQADFADWHENIQTLLHLTDPHKCFKWALFDRLPLTHWAINCTTLLGDACHPTLPFMAQGAAMAIEDAAVLRRCLGHYSHVIKALEHYEGLRKNRTSRIQAASRRNARIFHLAGISAWARNQVASGAGKHMMDWLYAYDPLTVKLP